MNISPSTLLVVGAVTAVINVLIALALVARTRAHRARHVVELDGILSSSYIGSGPGDPTRLPPDEPPVSQGWHGSTVRLADIEAGWPAIAFGASMPPSVEEAATPEVEPFEYPAPTSLEQRSMDQQSINQQSMAQHDAAPRAEDDDETADRGEVVDELENGAEDTAEAEAEDHGGAMVDEQAESESRSDDDADEVPAAPVLTALPTAAPPSAPHGRDALTGMLDALSFEEALTHEDARAQRYHRSATVIVFELDGLAKLVDRLGSDPGDRIEAALGDTITRLARRADYVARIERGRYAALLPETDEVAAINYVERIRRACDLWLESGAIAMRLAIGWASTSGDATLDGALRTATDRMRMESRRNSRLGGDVTEMPADQEASGL